MAASSKDSGGSSSGSSSGGGGGMMGNIMGMAGKMGGGQGGGSSYANKPTINLSQPQSNSNYFQAAPPPEQPQNIYTQLR